MDDVLAVVTVDDVQLSPDGKEVAFVTTSRDLDANAQNADLWMVRASGGIPVRLTRDPKADTSPRWSPDGRWLAFLSARAAAGAAGAASEAGGKAQVWLIDPAGGEPVQLTAHKEAIAAFEWSPDGRSIAFVATEPRPEEEEQRIKARWTPRVVGEDLRFNALWRIDLDAAIVGGEAAANPGTRAVKPQARQLSAHGQHVSTFDWSPDGARLVYSAATSPDLIESDTADLYLVSRDGGDARRLAGFSSADSQPKWSPDGTRVLFSSRGDTVGTAWNARLFTVDIASGRVAPSSLTASYDESVNAAEWAPDGSRVFFVGTQRTQRHLFVAGAGAADRAGVRALTQGRQVIGRVSFDKAFTKVAFVREAPGEPQDVFIAELDHLAALGEPVRLTDLNPHVRELAQGEQEVLTWKNRDGDTVEGILIKPVGYQAGTRYPLLTVIHGGPAGVDTDGFIHRKSAYPVQVFAGKGYATLLVNYRGSVGYGERWLKGNVGSLGAKEFDDIERGIDAVIASGVADADRLGFAGWSYGGHMAYWAVTHSARFKAASSGAGATNLISMYAQTDIPHFYTKTYFGKAPWEDFTFWIEHSSFFKVGSVKTPTLIQYGENDARVPLPQGLEFHRALKERGVPTQLVIYPGQGHAILEPRFQKDLLQRNVDWFDRWILGDAPKPAAPASTSATR